MGIINIPEDFQIEKTPEYQEALELWMFYYTRCKAYEKVTPTNRKKYRHRRITHDEILYRAHPSVVNSHAWHAAKIEAFETVRDEA